MKPINGAKLKLAAELVRAELRCRGWSVKDLAYRLGVSSAHVSNLLVGNVRSRTVETQIEGILNRAVWTTEEEFWARQSRAGTESAASEQEKEKQ